MDDLVSVVIPAYRAESFIHRSVRSVLAQTWTHVEVIIASDDGTDYAHVLRDRGVSDSRVRYVSTGERGTGAANARNTGLDASRGRIIATLDADDALVPAALEILVPLALEHGAAYSRLRFVDDDTGAELTSFDRPLGSGRVRLEDILTSQIHTYAGIVFDRQRITARWPEWLPRWEDVYFYARCFDDVEHLYHVAEPLYEYHRVAGSICNRPETGKEYLAWADRLATRLEQGHDLGIGNDSSRRVFRRFLRSRQAIEASFMDAVAQGRCRDFHSFIGGSPDAFYSFDVRVT